jgi:hypothetical protein
LVHCIDLSCGGRFCPFQRICSVANRDGRHLAGGLTHIHLPVGFRRELRLEGVTGNS